jgi:hypothetical protein
MDFNLFSAADLLARIATGAAINGQVSRIRW